MERTKTYDVKAGFEAKGPTSEWHKQGARFTAPEGYEVPSMPVIVTDEKGNETTEWVSPVVEVKPEPIPEPEAAPALKPKKTAANLNDQE